MSFDPLQRIADLEQAVAERDARIAAQDQTIVTLQETVATLLARIQELEDRLNRNSGNSSTPPSANPPWAPKTGPKKSSGRKPGGQPGHKGHHRAELVPDEIRNHWPERCKHCHAGFIGDEPEAGTPVRHQVTEIPPIKPIVTEHRMHAVRCACGKKTRADHPDGVPAGQFGPRIIALAALLGGRYRITRREMVAIFKDGFGVAISLGTAQRLCEQASRALEKPFEEVAKAVLAQDVVHADETGWRHRGKRAWLWVVSNHKGSAFRLAPGRGHEARRSILPDDYHGTVVTDRWHVYGLFERRGLCHAHLERNWKAISERKHPDAKRLGDWGVEETRRLLVLNRQFRGGEVTEAQFRLKMKMVKARYARLLNAAEDCVDPKTRTMAQQLNEVWSYLWTFATVPGVEPTNNEAERAIRPAVLWRKGSLGTWSEAGQRFVERMLTVAATARKTGTPLLEFLLSACQARLSHLPAPRFYPAAASQPSSWAVTFAPTIVPSTP